MRGFGFGNKLGIDLPGEEEGILGNWRTWDKLKPTRVPIGQGVAVTGLQMVNAYSTIANGGKLMRPYVVDKIVKPNGEVVFQTKPQVLGTPIRPEVAQAIREMLIGVTEDGGTGTRANVKGYTIAGKTGTAQHAVVGGYSSTEYFASFVGFVPARDPVFSVLVSVDRPKPQHTGGFVASPVFGKIAAATTRYLQVQPDLPDE
jgi:cell division protein FtsI (penicillin-binding protein 3)